MKISPAARGLAIVLFMVMALLGALDSQLFPLTPLQTSGGSSSSSGALRKALFILGDSSVDCGENTLFYPILHTNLSLLPCNGSNSTLPHFLAEKMGLPKPPAFYGQNNTIQGLLNGLNFGSAMASILLTNPNIPHFQSLNQQLRQAFDTIQLLQLQLGQSTANQFIESSIFYLSFGKDDYIHFLRHNYSSLGLRSRHSGHRFAHILVDQMMKVMRDLYDANARKIICVGILPLGCAPRTVLEWRPAAAAGKNGEQGCIDEINKLVFEYNMMLKEHIFDLNRELPHMHIAFCDVYQAIKDIVADPQKYGFKDATSACCGIGKLGAMIGCLSTSTACNQSLSHVWWDLYNPTEAVNSLLANSAWSGQQFAGMCRPMTVQDLVHAS